MGPIPGPSNWDVGQWGYPDGGTLTDAEFWVYCTENFGGVITADALAADERTESPRPTLQS